MAIHLKIYNPKQTEDCCGCCAWGSCDCNIACFACRKLLERQSPELPCIHACRCAFCKACVKEIFRLNL